MVGGVAVRAVPLGVGGEAVTASSRACVVGRGVRW